MDVRRLRQIRRVARAGLNVQLRLVALVFLALAHHGRVDRDDERLEAERPCHRDQLQRPLFLVRHVELEQEAAARAFPVRPSAPWPGLRATRKSTC